MKERERDFRKLSYLKKFIKFKNFKNSRLNIFKSGKGKIFDIHQGGPSE